MGNSQIPENLRLNLLAEIIFTAVRSSGPGGQHVNKVSTRVELRFNIPGSKLISEDQKRILHQKLKNKITDQGDLIIRSQENRSQLQNKETALEKFYQLIEKALQPVKKRIPTKSTPGSKEKRLMDKKKLSALKRERKLPDDEK